MLSELQKDTSIPVRISDIDVEGARAVDDKLIILARQLRSPILTNDYNLNRVAELQGVRILNVNELANAVKAVFLPGEMLSLDIIQEGREAGQGVGYLDDGTMVVVEGGNAFLGKAGNYNGHEGSANCCGTNDLCSSKWGKRKSRRVGVNAPCPCRYTIRSPAERAV